MFRRISIIVAVVFTALSLSGCATVGAKNATEIQGLRDQVSSLQAQVQSKDAQISDLQQALDKASQEKQAVQETAQVAPKKNGRVIGEAKAHPKAREIQIALKNAGYDPGPVDGRMGKQTKKAIRAFQKDHNLQVTGRVHEATWALLKEFAFKKVK